jgi:3-oxo-5-alpha-steroid 4-dehydrogenase 3
VKRIIIFKRMGHLTLSLPAFHVQIWNTKGVQVFPILLEAHFHHTPHAMDPALLCKVFFGLGTAVDLGGTLIPSFRRHIMNYGSRGAPPDPSKISEEKPTSLFRYIADCQVPHTWFTHYYVVSVASSLFWGFQIYTRGPAIELLATYSKPASETMTVNQVFLAWLFMAVQGTRRLYESLTLTKPSQSKMWFGLWILGIAYYIFMGISVWIEGICKSTDQLSWSKLTLLAAVNQIGSFQSLLDISSPSVKTLIAVSIFLLASWIQHDCHKYLASLKKYTLPDHQLFQFVVCPHYTSECLVYIAIAIVAAPKDQLLNRTVLAGLGFVVSNLAVTADSTKKWYVEKFGLEKVAGRWRMVPYLY